MSAHHHSRRYPPPGYPLNQTHRSRAWLRSIALASALASSIALMPCAHAQNNGAANGIGAKAAAGNGNNANGAPPRKTAAQRSEEDAQRLLGGPGTSLGGYEMEGATPDSERTALLNSERMRAARPNTQGAGGPAAAGENRANAGGNAGAAAAAIKRPARGGAAANAGVAADGGVGGAGPAGAAGQRGGATLPTDPGVAANAVYGNPYNTPGARTVYRSPW